MKIRPRINFWTRRDFGQWWQGLLGIEFTPANKWKVCSGYDNGDKEWWETCIRLSIGLLFIVLTVEVAWNIVHIEYDAEGKQLPNEYFP